MKWKVIKKCAIKFKIILVWQKVKQKSDMNLIKKNLLKKNKESK